MGLSNEERYAKIAYSISHMDELSEKLTTYRSEKLKQLVGRFWYEFLRADSNSAFWLFGSELSNNCMPAESLTGVAFACHKPGRGNTLEDLSNERREKDRYFDSYKILSGFFDIDRLLEGEKRSVLLVYVHSQNIAYALCRYKDEFLTRYEDLNVLLRTTQGECFNIMKKDRDYAHAWMLHNLCDQIYTMDEKDIVNQWWTKHHNPHDIKIRYNQYDAVYQVFKKYQFKKMTVQDRIDVSLVLLGDKYGEFEHQHKEFLEMVNAYNKVKKHKVKINVQAIEEAFQRGQKAQKEEKEKPYERSCDFTDNYVDNKGEVQNLWD